MFFFLLLPFIIVVSRRLPEITVIQTYEWFEFTNIMACYRTIKETGFDL